MNGKEQAARGNLVYTYHILELRTMRRYIEQAELNHAVIGLYNDDYYFLHSWRVALARAEYRLVAAEKEGKTVEYLNDADFAIVKYCAEWVARETGGKSE